MSLIDYAKRELDYRLNYLKDRPRKDWEEEASDLKMERVLYDNVLELIETFSKQDHSGSTAPFVLALFKELATWRPITPLTGNNEEWNDVNDGLYQNKRCPCIFKNIQSGEAYTIEGIVFKTENEDGWYTNKYSHIPITFPYTPTNPKRIVVKQSCYDYAETYSITFGKTKVCTADCPNCANFVREVNNEH